MASGSQLSTQGLLAVGGGGWRGANRLEEQAVFICEHLFTDSTSMAESSCC